MDCILIARDLAVTSSCSRHTVLLLANISDPLFGVANHIIIQPGIPISPITLKNLRPGIPKAASRSHLMEKQKQQTSQPKQTKRQRYTLRTNKERADVMIFIIFLQILQYSLKNGVKRTIEYYGIKKRTLMRWRRYKPGL